jgi:hypothetical protein
LRLRVGITFTSIVLSDREATPRGEEDRLSLFLFIPVATGAAAGVAHVLLGPDHLAAVAPIAIRYPVRALRTGAAWGLGHASGALILGLLSLWLRHAVPITALSRWAEFVVGLVLLGVGAWAFHQARLARRHLAAHAAAPAGAAPPHAHPGHTTHAAFGVGALHGAAGIGHLLGVLPSLALPPAQAVQYLFAYGLAAVAAMAGFGYLLGRLHLRLRGVAQVGLIAASGCFAAGLGVYWLISGWPLR